MQYPLWEPPAEVDLDLGVVGDPRGRSIHFSCCVGEHPLKAYIAYTPTAEKWPRWWRWRNMRIKNFTNTVELYYYQIRHGCGSPNCRTPTCGTYQRLRATEQPYRAPTQRTARAMAASMASQDDSRSRLCPFLSYTPGLPDHAFADLYADQILPNGHQSSKSESVKDSRSSLVDGVGASHSGKPAGSLDRIPESSPTSGRRSMTDSGSNRLDPKSFTQQLFDTQAWAIAPKIDSNYAEDTSNTANLDSKITEDTLGADGADIVTFYADGVNLQLSTCAKHRDLLLRAYLTRLDPRIIDVTRRETSLSNLFFKTGNPAFPPTTPDAFSSTPTASAPVPKELHSATARDFNSRFLQYFRRSIFYVLSTPDALAESFLDKDDQSHDQSHDYPTIGVKDMRNCFYDMFQYEPDHLTILPTLWESLAEAYLSHSSHKAANGASNLQKSEHKAAHLVCVALGALAAAIPVNWSVKRAPSNPEAMLQALWTWFVSTRKDGRFFPRDSSAINSAKPYSPLGQKALDMLWAYENGQALRLMKRTLRVFCSWSFLAGSDVSNDTTSSSFVQHVVRFLASSSNPSRRNEIDVISCSNILLEWARVLLRQSWDGKPVFLWSSDTGCAIEFMRILYENRSKLFLSQEDFEMPSFFKGTDFMEVPKLWLSFKPSGVQGHLLSFPWLFPQPNIVTYFRVINHSKMFRAVNASASMQALVARHKTFGVGREEQIYGRLKTVMDQFLVLEIRRKRILDDALSGLWRRQKRELSRPLKIRMGLHEGEEGVDLGGIQQEFFRLALGEALDPQYGLFSVDDTTQMAWFLPRSLTRDYHFNLIGMLVGLAIYNGITLSVTFPLALYRKLLGYPVSTIDHIIDGWPMLGRGLQAMLDCRAEEVEDVFMRSYVFSFEANGQIVHINMDQGDHNPSWLEDSSYCAVQPKSLEVANSRSRDADRSLDGGNEGPSADAKILEESRGVVESSGSEHDSKEASTVTGKNRDQYVKDYIFWLTEKSIKPQYDAFSRGFFMCVDRKALELFTPQTLKDLVEGFQEIDLIQLSRVTKYENGYSRDHAFINSFWKVVEGFTPQEIRKLLEFVTASNRIPAKGIENVAFIIQRNGEDDKRIPTSLTCFGRLLLPQYSSETILEAKLRQAIEHSLGFGVA